MTKKETEEQEPNEPPEPTAHEAALKSIEGLFEEAVKALKCYNKIKTALMTPTINYSLQKDQSWNLPVLNKTAR